MKNWCHVASGVGAGFDDGSAQPAPAHDAGERLLRLTKSPAQAVGSSDSHSQIRFGREPSGTPIYERSLVAGADQNGTCCRLAIGLAPLDAGCSRGNSGLQRGSNAGACRLHAYEDAIDGRNLA